MEQSAGREMLLGTGVAATSLCNSYSGSSCAATVFVLHRRPVAGTSGMCDSCTVLVRDAPPHCTLPSPQEQGKPHVHPNILMDFINNKMNKTELVQGAIFDLLFSQCDRHQQNIFLEETGKVWLIDNDQVGCWSWKVKGTQKQ